MKELDQERSEYLTTIKQLSAPFQFEQAEREDLLMLLSDQDAKLEEYMKKLVELGVEVNAGRGSNNASAIVAYM